MIVGFVKKEKREKKKDTRSYAIPRLLVLASRRDEKKVENQANIRIASQQ